MKDSVIIVSGGMDSVTLLYDYMERIALAVTFDYGSKHNEKEIACAKLHCERLGIKHLVIPLAFMQQYFKSSLLKGGEEIPEGNYNDENMKSTVVPFRNGIMLAVAAGLADSNNLRYVMMANHSGDHSIYPDCTPQFVEAMNLAIYEGTGSSKLPDHTTPSIHYTPERTYHTAPTHKHDRMGVSLIAPYTNISKADVARRGKALGIDYSETWSCYKGGDKHCGKCGTCTERIQALREAGIIDTTEYEGSL